MGIRNKILHDDKQKETNPSVVEHVVKRVRKELPLLTVLVIVN
jgi:hypothetical protein